MLSSFKKDQYQICTMMDYLAHTFVVYNSRSDVAQWNNGLLGSELNLQPNS
jgi:hypothetical protein